VPNPHLFLDFITLIIFGDTRAYPKVSGLSDNEINNNNNNNNNNNKY
jgi:hypothetical protein